jgi:hypothetical protein
LIFDENFKVENENLNFLDSYERDKTFNQNELNCQMESEN